MPMIPDRSGGARARRLAAFADARVRGEAIPPADADERMTDHLNTTLGLTFRAASAMPDGERARAWEDLMQETLTATTSATVSVPAGKRGFGERAGSRVTAWQSAVSLIVVLGFLVAIVGIAYQRIPGSGPDDNGSGAELGAQVPYEAGDKSLLYAAAADCTTNGGTFTDDRDVRKTDVTSWSRPVYFPASPVDPDVGNAVLNTYLDYIRCWQDLNAAMPYNPATPAAVPALSLSLQSYYSDRYRFASIQYDGLDDSQHAAINSFYCSPRRDMILSTFPLPVNQPEVFAVFGELVDGTPTLLFPAFKPTDVYELPDGRFITVSGTVTTEELLIWMGEKEPTTQYRSTGVGNALQFTVFVERDGAYLIDEIFGLGALSAGDPAYSQTGRCEEGE